MRVTDARKSHYTTEHRLSKGVHTAHLEGKGGRREVGIEQLVGAMGCMQYSRDWNRNEGAYRL